MATCETVRCCRTLFYSFNPPIVDGHQEACRDLIIEAGAGIDIDEGVLSIFGDADIHGDLSLLHTSSDVFIYGDVVWNAGSTGSMTGSATIDCEGDWDFNDGADVQFTAGFVEFSGESVSFIRSFEENCQIHHLRNHKSDPYYFGISATSTADLHIHGNIYNYSDCHLRQFSNHTTILDGFLNNMGGHFDFDMGTLKFNGNPSVALKPNTGDLVNNLIINTSSPLNLGDDYTDELIINGDVEITGGSFVPGSFTLRVKGDWTNTAGTAGFVETGSRVIFEKTSDQFMNSNETFDILEIDCGGRLVVGNYEVTCAAYDWTSGGFGVSDGSFTANDLIDPGLFGVMAVAEGEINLINDGFVDLRGELSVFGGTVNISGTFSWWPYNQDASLTMTDGIIDMKTCGIKIVDEPYDFNDALSGGTIRTVGNFENERADVDLSNVTIEMYGTSSAELNLEGGSAIGYLNINKEGVDGLPEIKQTDRKGNLLPARGKTNNVSFIEDATIENETFIYSGSLNLYGHNVNVGSDLLVFDGGSLIMDNPADVLEISDRFSWLQFQSGSTALFSAGNIILNGWVLPENDCIFTATTSNTITLIGMGGGLSCREPSAVYGNIVFNNDPGLRAYIDGSATYPVVVNGDFTLNPENILEVQSNTVIVHGNYIDFPTSELQVFNYSKNSKTGNAIRNRNGKPEKIKMEDKGAKGGYFEVDNFLTINGILNIGEGEMLAHDIFEVAETGSVIINDGSFICDAPKVSSKVWNYIDGHVEMSGGLFEITNNSISFTETASTFITGGTIRSGWAFSASYPGTFNAIGGVLEFNCVSTAGNIFCPPGNSLHKLLINNQNGSTMHYRTDLIVVNDLTIQAGSLECDYGEAGIHNLNVGGNWSDNTNGFIPNKGTVTFIGNGSNQILTDANFYNLIINKSYFGNDGLNLNPELTCTVNNDFTAHLGTFKLGNNTSFIVKNDVLLELYAGLNTYGNTGIEIFVEGDWNNENIGWDTYYGYSPETETLTFNGSTNQIFTSAAPREEIGNLVINKPDGEFKPESNINVKGDLLIEDGIWRDGATGLSHYFEGDFTTLTEGRYNTLFTDNTTVFKGTADQTIYYPDNGYFSKVIIDKTDWPEEKVTPEGFEKNPAMDNPGKEKWALTVTMLSDLDFEFGDGLIVDEGTLLVNGFSLKVMGGVDVNEGGKLVLEGGSQLKIDTDDQLNINEGGIFHAVGTPEDKAVVSHYQEGYYGFEVQSGGVIRAQDAIFEYIGIDYYGLHIMDGAFVDPSYSFENCEFRNGNIDFPVGALITINSDQDITINNASFPNASAAYNVVKDFMFDHGHVLFNEATGEFAGPEFEYDENNRIDWFNSELEVSPETQNVTAEAGATTFEITSNLDWTVAEDVDWLSVEPLAGSGDATITVSYDANNLLESRNGQIIISAEGVEDVVVAVAQEEFTPTLFISPATDFVDPDAGITAFNLESNNDWEIIESYDWLTVSPISGNGDELITVTFDQNATGEERLANIVVSAYDGLISMVFALTQEAYTNHQIFIPAGWSGVSSYVMPAETNITDLMDPITADLTILQTMDAMYYPAGSVNTIGTWGIHSAYKIKVTADAELSIIGDEETNKTLELNVGWNLLPVVCNTHVNAEDLILGSDIVILKEVAGTGILWPEYEINTLDVLTPGKSYFALSSGVGSLTFPPNVKNASYESPETLMPHHPWNEIPKGPSTHNIAILSDGFSGLMLGDLIGIFDENDNCFGVSEIKSLSENAVISAFADDPYTYEKDGFEVNDPMKLKLFRPASSEVFSIEVIWDAQQANSSFFENEGISVISSFKVSNVGINEALSSSINIHPNPSSGMVEISGIEKFNHIGIFNSGGEMIRTYNNNNDNILKLNLNDLPPGIYQVKFTGVESSVIKKLIRK